MDLRKENSSTVSQTIAQKVVYENAKRVFLSNLAVVSNVGSRPTAASRARRQKPNPGKHMTLVEYLYIDEDRLNAYHEQVSSPVVFDKTPIWGA